MSIIPTLSMKAERKWFMSSYAFKLASERPWEALVGPTEETLSIRIRLTCIMEGSHTSLLVRVYLALCSLESEELSYYVHRSQLVHDCFFLFLPPSLPLPSTSPPSFLLTEPLLISILPLPLLPPSLPSKFLPPSSIIFSI